LGAHTLPAAWMMDGAFRKYLFTATCVLVIGAALFGLVVLRRYERDPPAAEKRLLIAYSLITLGAYGAGFAEFYQIGSNAIARLRTGLWPDFGALPHALAGYTPYDRLPEVIGWTGVRSLDRDRLDRLAREAPSDEPMKEPRAAARHPR
jgi:hypothetical protein